MAAGANVGDVCVCGSTFAQRSDDTPEAINRRLDIYENETQPIIAKYEEQGLVRRVDGVGTVEEVQARMVKILQT
jgi:adenylate kinase